jgi:hypothetical protein
VEFAWPSDEGSRRKSDAAVRLFAKCFLLLVGVLVYHQSAQTKQYQEKLRTACAARGGKLTLSNLSSTFHGHKPSRTRGRT